MPTEQPVSQTDTSTLADAISDVIIESLRARALSELNNLLGHQNNIKNLHSNLDRLKAHYNIDTSYINQAAEWYGTRTWYQKAGLATAFVATSALIGSLTNIALLFTFVAGCIYYAVTSLLMHHYETTTTRDERLFDDISTAQKILSNAITPLIEIESKLNSIFVELWDKNIKMDEELIKFKQEIAVLNGQTTALLAEVTKLTLFTDSLVIDNENVTKQLDLVRIEADKAQNEARNNAEALDAVTCKLDETNNQLLAKNSEFIEMSNKFQDNLAALITLEHAFKEQLEILGKDNTEYESLKTKLHACVDREITISTHTDGALDKGDETLKKCWSLLAYFAGDSNYHKVTMINTNPFA